jgi:hypothetical protein
MNNLQSVKFADRKKQGFVKLFPKLRDKIQGEKIAIEKKF